MVANSVVLPAPLGPIRAVMRPASTASDTSSTASRPPKRLETCATRSSGSAMGALRCGGARREARAPIEEQAGDPARRKGDDQDQEGAVDHEIEPRRAAGRKPRRFAQG